MNKALCILILLCCSPILGQVNSTEGRPKVGLALSGGAAHGIAHIGVLKVLEEQGVHVDYITGTSMGSIIGGLSAMGMSAEEIQDLTEAQNWSDLLSTSVPLNEIAPSEKLYHDRFGLTVEIRNGGLKLPEGFLNSQKLDLQLNRMFCPAHNINDFDKLPYPFKCVSVNIENGDVEIIDNGYLGNAVRSSMAIPSVFSPVEMNGKLLVDGGLIRNFPVDEAIDMGADIIIGVYVGSKLEKREKLNNLLEILNQSAFMMGVLDSEEQKKKVDILIEPDVKNLPTFGFDLTDVLIREGYIAATEHIDEFRMIAESQQVHNIEKPEKLKNINSIELADTRFPFIRSPYDALANFKYGSDKRGNTSLDRIENGITRIFGTKHFSNINYTFRTNSREERVLAVLAKPKKVNSVAATFNFMPSTSTALILTNELRNVVNEPSVLYTTVRLAENFAVKVDYNYRLGSKKDFILNVFGQAQRFDQNLYQGEILRKKYTESNAVAQIGVGHEPNNNILLSAKAGISGNYLKPIGIDEEGLRKYQRINGTISVAGSYDNINDVQFPASGFRIGIEGGLYAPINSSITSGSGNPLDIAEDKMYVEGHLKGIGVYTLISGVTAEIMLSGGYKSTTSLTDNYRVGGLENRNFKSLSMLGLNTHQIHLDQYYKGGLALRFQLMNAIYFSVRGDYLKGQRVFNFKEDADLDNIALWGYGGLLGVRTPLGPIKLSYGRNTLSNSWNTNFTFGYSFF